jgi:hypothetical protein
LFLKKGKYFSRNGRNKIKIKRKLAGGNFFGFLVGQSENRLGGRNSKNDRFTFVLYFLLFFLSTFYLLEIQIRW